MAFTLSPNDVASRKVKSSYRRLSVIARETLLRNLNVLKHAAMGVFRTSGSLTERQLFLGEFLDNKLSVFHTSEKPLGQLGIASILRLAIV